MSVAPVACSARARRTVLSRPCTSPTHGAPRRRLDVARPAASIHSPCVLSPDRPRDDPGVPRPRGL
eukprot:6615131-Prymnesium_polylepis.1